MTDSLRRAAFLALVSLAWPATGGAQMHHHHPAPADTTAHRSGRPAGSGAARPGGHAHGSMAHEGMHGMEMGQMPMRGMDGPYAMSREASGTAWQPEATPHEGVHLMRGPWRVMLHGFADLVYDDQSGGRGDRKLFSGNMGMAMAQRPLGAGTLGLRGMLSLEPATIGKQGYPLLLQTGETADGRTPLIDRQHPHDLFMELAGVYSLARGDRSLFVYGGLPGEPALGPPTFMHRFSGAGIPVAPITHHWLDSTHITYGVLTAGAVVDRMKVEASAFHGREPDEKRWNIESPKLDSHAFRISANPSEHWALQASYGRLHGPEQLEPEVDQDRVTASAMVGGPLHDGGRWQGTLAWGRNRNRPGETLDAVLAEAAFELGERHTLFVRGERVEKNELFAPPDPRAGEAFDVGEVTAGYRCDVLQRGHVALGIGAAGTLTRVPHELRRVYGNTPAAGLLFLHAALR